MNNINRLNESDIELLAKSYIEDYFKKYNGLNKGFHKYISFDNFLDILCNYAIYERKRLKSPVTVSWDITANCNLKCLHCYGGNRHYKEYGFELSTEACHKVIDQMNEANVLRIIISGGEAFLRKDLIELLDHIKSYDIGVEILTNGTVIDEEHLKKMEEILRLDHDIVQVSLDGPSPEIHDKQRGIKCFNKVLRGIKLLVESKIITILKMTVTNINYKYIVETYELAQELGVDAFATEEVRHVGKAKTLPDIHDRKELLIASLELIKRNLEMEESVMYINGLHSYIFNYPELRKYLPKKNPPQVPLIKCPAGTAECKIDYKGDVYPCDFLHIDRFKAGNVFKKNLIEIWRGNKAFNSLRKGRYFSKVKCSKCEFLYFCRGGCPGSAYAKFGTINAPDPRCKYNPNRKNHNLR